MKAHILGFPRIGRNRELKQAVERFQRGKIDAAALQACAADLKQNHWQTQADAGLSLLPCGDFSFYDHILDTLCLLGLVPQRFQHGEGPVDLATYFHMARGDRERNIAAMEMTKWFDTNYHYLVPELPEQPRFRIDSTGLVRDIEQIHGMGCQAKVVLPGPVSLVMLAKPMSAQRRRLWFDALTEAYQTLLRRLGRQAAWIQLDEPIAVLDLDDDVRREAHQVWRRLAATAAPARLLFAAYFAPYGDNLDVVCDSGFDAVHLDLQRGRDDLDALLARLPSTMQVSLGLVDGRNIWKTDLHAARQCYQSVVARLGEGRVAAATSCSLLHVPVDLASETQLAAHLRDGMAFAVQKCVETALIAAPPSPALEAALADNQAALTRFRDSALAARPAVRRRLANVTETELTRSSPYARRRRAQAAWLKLPLLPTTTIGSFPQTTTIRAKRRLFKRGEIHADAYQQFLKDEIRHVIQRQEALGLDVLVHGEAERNDMVEYFGEQLEGFCFTENGWVQSYGSRCVKPPIIYGDIQREKAMTVDWITYAQSLTDKPVKAMLTGPVTLLCWSFVRDDVPRDMVCRQLALAVRDEVADLEQAGVRLIQIDEAALREGLPLRKADQSLYLSWAVDAFRLASAGVGDATQIHTHMCYSAFNEIIAWIARLDADVVSIECSRSGMTLLDAFETFDYPNEVGPGVYDIHSPRLPRLDEMVRLLQKALQYLPAERLWVNPDCGLKTRRWEECEPALAVMVQAARQLRLHLSAQTVG